MAYYAALVSVVQLLKEISHHDRYRNSLLDEEQIASLYEKFNLLQELLEDYSSRGKEKSTDFLERRIRDAAYQIQDIVESHIHPKKKAHGVKRFSQDLVFRKAPQQLQPQRFESLKLDNIVEREYYQDLEKVKEEVDSIAEELKRIKESSTTHEDLQLGSYISAEASKVQAPSGRNVLVGFEEDLTTIKEQLCGESSKLQAISIVGMGGLGKTTLARNIFEDKLIDYHFDCRGWVTISQVYHKRKVLLDIGSSLNIMNEELSRAEEEVIAERIYKYLIVKRYLVIIDDMWDTKVWDDMRRIFPDNSNRSRIIVTTRLSEVATCFGKFVFVHQMQFLNDDQSWNLLREKVFAQEHCPRDLEVIGKLTAINCRGLPLAIVVIAGVLSNVSKSRHDWEEISRNVSSVAMDQNDEHFSKILSLSYDHLPHHLKPCFLYLGGFPEDYEISASRLMKLWVAEGFLKPIESKSLEEVGERYLEDLVKRNLVFITKKNFHGKIKCCSIHDLLRDLCSQRASYENFLHCLHKKSDFHRESVGNIRRLFIHPGDSSFCKYEKELLSLVRAILIFANVLSSNQFLSIASDFKLLRVFEIESIFRFTFPDEVVELLHLRYLALWASKIRIPSSIFKLQNLQTLIIDAEASLPSEIWKMPQLRHVMIRILTLLPIPYGDRIRDDVPLLGRLQTLWRVEDFIFTRDTIEMIPSLKKLKVRYTYEPYKNWQEFGLNNLVHLQKLERLDIRFSMFVMVAVPLPENFAFPPNLKRLSLYGCRLPWKDMSVVGSLPNLQVLKLEGESFLGEEWETVEGEFPLLKFLLMDGLHGLKYWRAENTHFPCLESLEIKYCRELWEIPFGIGDISTLEMIEVYGSKLAADSALKIQQEQREIGNEVLRVCIRP